MPLSNSSLNEGQRQQAIHDLAHDEFDILVVGGGINGVGIALDAASRGLRVALVESSDFAAGTSSKSSKLIHGGLRYLEQYDFKLVREALNERELMVSTLSPHLVNQFHFSTHCKRSSKSAPMLVPVWRFTMHYVASSERCRGTNIYRKKELAR